MVKGKEGKIPAVAIKHGNNKGARNGIQLGEIECGSDSPQT